MDLQTKIRENELVAAFKAGDRAAFDQLVLLFSPKLFRMAYLLLGNRQDAEEVVQDAFLRAYKSFGSFRGDSSFETWIHRITVNLSRNRFHWNRRRGKGVNVSISSPPPATDSFPSAQDWELPDSRMVPDRMLETRELESSIAGFIAQLPCKLRESLLLRHECGLSYRDISEKTGVPINTIKSRIKRGRELLKDLLVQSNAI